MLSARIALHKSLRVAIVISLIDSNERSYIKTNKTLFEFLKKCAITPLFYKVLNYCLDSAFGQVYAQII
jgi:hypothetical protein